jgi:hypothetical protein
MTRADALGRMAKRTNFEKLDRMDGDNSGEIKEWVLRELAEGDRKSHGVRASEKLQRAVEDLDDRGLIDELFDEKGDDGGVTHGELKRFVREND